MSTTASYLSSPQQQQSAGSDAATVSKLEKKKAIKLLEQIKSSPKRNNILRVILMYLLA